MCPTGIRNTGPVFPKRFLGPVATTELIRFYKYSARRSQSYGKLLQLNCQTYEFIKYFNCSF